MYRHGHFRPWNPRRPTLAGITVAVTSVLVLGCSDPGADAGPAEKADALERAAAAPLLTSEAEAVIATWWEENDKCRGGTMPAAQTFCDRREALSRELYNQGWCFGEGAQYTYQANWARCRSTSVDNGLTGSEQAEANQLALDYARNERIQAETRRQLEQRRRNQERRDRAALELIQ